MFCWSVLALFESVTYKTGIWVGAVYAPSTNPIASAWFMLVGVVPHAFGSLHDLMRRVFAHLFCHNVDEGGSWALMSGARIEMVVVAIPSKLRLPSMLITIGCSCFVVSSIISWSDIDGWSSIWWGPLLILICNIEDSCLYRFSLFCCIVCRICGRKQFSSLIRIL